MTCPRGTSNSNQRGNSKDRRKRRQYLVNHYRANVDLDIATGCEVPLGQGEAACRCYRCGCLLTVDTVTVDRRVPGAEGGTYWDLMNLRPACAFDNSSTGGALGAARRKAAS